MSKETAHGPALITEPFQNVVIVTDFNDDVANAQIEMRLRNVLAYTVQQRNNRTTLPEDIAISDVFTERRLQPPPVMQVRDIPPGNIDYAAYALYTCYRALGRTKPNLFIHVTDPGVGHSDDRSLLITDLGNTFIGPNNGTLGLLARFFAERNIRTKQWLLDTDTIETIEQARTESPTYHLPRTFHGRDLFGVVAGLVAGGVDPYSVVLPQSDGMPLIKRPFANKLQALPLQLKRPQPFFAMRDNTFGNLKTNLTLDSLSFDQLVDEGAKFRVRCQHKHPRGPFCWGNSTLTFPAKRAFAGSLQAGHPLLFLGSTLAPMWDERLVELALNMEDLASELGLPHHGSSAVEFTIERIV
jgi:S-adenosylmethionine hydrolase